MPEAINIARDFSVTPGPRYIAEGEYSGELFRDSLLAPAFERATARNGPLDIYLNGTEGYATSFLEESFGGLARIFGEQKVAATIRFHCDDDPFLIEEIETYIREAMLPRNQRPIG
jgi:hypothetical protein